MTEFISRKYGNDGYEVIIKTDSHEHYTAAEEFARRLIGHAKPVTDNNVGKWIPVTERLPEYGQEVLVYTGNMKKPIVMGYKFWKKDYDSWCHVTHWMPLPEPPKEVE